MTRIFRDALGVDRHQTFKRLERRAQWAAWKRRGEESESSALPCLWRAEPQDFPVARPAHLLALFQGHLELVRFTGDLELDGLRLLRGGVLWDQWHPWILRAYQRGASVPRPFVPLRRLPPDWVEKTLAGSVEVQHQFFSKLRETKLLPGLPKLEAPAVSAWMRWEEVRARFLDFNGSTGSTGSPQASSPQASSPREDSGI